MKRIAATLAFFLSAASVSAHPHIFVDTGFDLYFNTDGTLKEIKVTWSYDAFYSLLITEDLGLDLDGDLLLTDEENAAIQGFDMNWSGGFTGDLEILVGDVSVPLSAPRDYSTIYVLGRLTSFHTRDIANHPVPFDNVQIVPFDTTYYTAYEVTYPVTLHGIEGCEALVLPPQPSTALVGLQQQLSTLSPDADPADVGLADLSNLLATSVRVSCGAS